MKNCEVCGKSHHAHTENDLSNCLVWANDETRRLKEEVEWLGKHRAECKRRYQERVQEVLTLKAEVKRLKKLCHSMAQLPQKRMEYYASLAPAAKPNPVIVAILEEMDVKLQSMMLTEGE